MKTKIKIPVGFAPISELNSWLQPIARGDNAPSEIAAVQSLRRASLSLRVPVFRSASWTWARTAHRAVHSVLAVLLLALLASCVVRPDYKRPTSAAPAQY